MDNRSMNERLNQAEVKTIRTEDCVFLSYGEKQIIRPPAFNCIEVVKKEFNLDI